MIYAQTFITKPEVTGMYLWFPLEIGIPYVVATVLFGLVAPGLLRYVINLSLALCTVSGVIAILQVAHFPPAIRLADYYVYRSIRWDNVAGIRASGLDKQPE